MSSRSLSDLRPEFKAQVEGWLKNCELVGLDVLVYCTLRDDEEQAALYAQGRTTPGKIVTKAQPGQSAHNYGLALDFVPLLAGKPQWTNWALYDKAIDLAELRGMESLRRSKRFKEYAHLQFTNWKEHV